MQRTNYSHTTKTILNLRNQPLSSSFTARRPDPEEFANLKRIWEITGEIVIGFGNKAVRMTAVSIGPKAASGEKNIQLHRAQKENEQPHEVWAGIDFKPNID